MFDFTGVITKYLSCAAPVTAYPFTIGAWCWMDAVVGSKNTIVSLSQAASVNNFWSLYADNSATPKIGYIGKDGSTFSGNLSALTAPIGQWNLVGLELQTGSSSNTRVWVNGTAATVSNIITPTGVNTLGIGNLIQTPVQQPWDGAIGEVFAYTGALTASEWGALYQRISPDQVRRDLLVFYKKLIADLEGLGSTLTNTGAVGTRTHLALSYKQKPRSVPQIAIAGPGVTVPATQAAYFNDATALPGVSVSSDSLVGIRVFVDEPAVCGVTLTGGVTVEAGANNSSAFTLAGTPAALNTVIDTLTILHPNPTWPSVTPPYPELSRQVLVTITGIDDLGAEAVNAFAVNLTRASGVGEEMLTILGNAAAINKALDPDDGGIEVTPTTGFFGASEAYWVTETASGARTHTMLGVVVDGSNELNGHNILAGNLTGVLQGVI